MHKPFEKLREEMPTRLKSRYLFSEENIQKIFGHEAAEDEEPQRLKEYYFKNDAYEQVTANLKLRILVGHKGIGKSALFKIASAEDEKYGILPVNIKPNDVLNIYEGDDFLKSIQNWDVGLRKIISEKTVKFFSEDKVKSISGDSSFGPRLMSYLIDIVKNYKISDSHIAALHSNFLNNRRINVYIDDLDRGWKGREEDISRISALLNAVRDISNEINEIHFKIALRSDVYFLVRTSDESTDKIEGSVVWYTWNNHQILALLAKRIETFFGRQISERQLMEFHQEKLAAYLNPIMAEYFDGVGKWENAKIYRILMSLTRKRPRDLVKLCSLAARNAKNRESNVIETKDLQAIFEIYSLERIQDIENEFKSELPDVKRLLFSLKPSVKKSKKYSDSYVYDTETLLAKIDTSRKNAEFYFSYKEMPATGNELLHFLYKINFLTARRINKDGKTIRKYFEENKYLTSKTVDFGFSWEVHPAYRWALEPDDIDVIYQKLDLLDAE